MPDYIDKDKDCSNPKAYPDNGIVLKNTVVDHFGIFDSGMTGFVSRMKSESFGDQGVIGMQWSNKNIAKSLDQLFHLADHYQVNPEFYESAWIWPSQ